MKKADKTRLRSTVAWALFAGLAATGGAFAQTPETPTEGQPAAEGQQPAAAPAEDEAIVVTGSRIRRSEFNSASPVQVLQGESAALAGVADTAEFLQGSSLASGSAQNDATISSAFVTDGGPGSATLSLRGLGATRTLVLLNGRRLGPAGTRGAVSSVDLNVIPQSIIDRVEILKDGASSIYGSDAIAGVANIITRRNTEGFEVEAFGNFNSDGGGEEYSIEGIWGRSFDRGYLNLSLDYYRLNELKLADRDYLGCSESYTFSAATGLRTDLIDPRTGRFQCRGDTLAGQVWLYEYINAGPFATTGGPLHSPDGRVLVQYDGSGQIGTLAPSSIFPRAGTAPAGWPTAPANWFGVSSLSAATAGLVNYGGDLYRQQSLIPETDRYSFYAQGAYDITPGVEAYAEVLLNRRETRTVGFRQYWTYLYTNDGGGFFGSDPFNVGWNGLAILSPTPVTDHNDAEQIVDYMRAIGGLRGEFAAPNNLGSWGWDIYGQFSRSDGDYNQDVILNDAVRSAQFRTASCVGTNLPVSGRPCIDVNWLSPELMSGNPTAAERAFLFDVESGNTVYDQVYLEGVITGDVFTLPAGNVGLAVGAHYREDEIKDVPGAVTLAGNAWGSSSAGITEGSDTIQELFAEVEVPVLAGMPLAEDLRLTLSGRYTDVETAGEADTYKIGISYQVTPMVQLRYTTGTSFRAPGLFENYLAEETSFIGQRQIDPCINWGTNVAAGNIPQRVADNCAADGIPPTYGGQGASATSIRRGALRPGSPGPLQPETSDAWTVGLVFTPSAIALNVALDYTEIEITDTITAFGPANIVAGCYYSLNFATEGLCDLFDRGATASPFLITEIRNPFINIAEQTNRALDLTVQYDHEFAWGDFSLQSQLTWQLEDVVALFPGRRIDINGDVGEPDFVGNVDLRLDAGDFTYFWGVDMVGKASEAEDVGDRSASGATLYKVHTEFTAYHAASVRYNGDQWSLTGGISNLFDEQPPTLTRGGILGQYSTQGLSVLSSQYDYVGRRAFVRLTRAW